MRERTYLGGAQPESSSPCHPARLPPHCFMILDLAAQRHSPTSMSARAFWSVTCLMSAFLERLVSVCLRDALFPHRLRAVACRHLDLDLLKLAGTVSPDDVPCLL